MLFVIAFCLALVLTPAARRLGHHVGLVDAPGPLKIHEGPIPLAGGLAVIAAAFGAFVMVRGSFPIALGLATLLSLGIGMVDDARPLRPWARLVGQAMAGAILAAGLSLPSPEPFFFAAVVALVMSCANAVNLIDGQDGLAGGLGASAAVGLAFITVGNPGQSGVGLSLGGALIGFLVWNRPPARIYLGNGGAYALGTLLAGGAAVAAFRWGVPGLLGAGLCLGVFAFELLFTVARRIGQGGGLVSGDRFHSYDLIARNHDRPTVTVFFWAVGAVAAAVGALVARLPIDMSIAGTAGVGIAAVWVGHRLWPPRSQETAIAGGVRERS